MLEGKEQFFFSQPLFLENKRFDLKGQNWIGIAELRQDNGIFQIYISPIDPCTKEDCRLW